MKKEKMSYQRLGEPLVAFDLDHGWHTVHKIPNWRTFRDGVVERLQRLAQKFVFFELGRHAFDWRIREEKT